MSDGGRIGHRDYQRYYKQRYRKGHQRTTPSTLRKITRHYLIAGGQERGTIAEKAIQRDLRVKKLRQKQARRYEDRSYKLLGKYFRHQTGLK